MKNIKSLTTFFALIFIAMPVMAFADGKFYYGTGGFYESDPVKNTGTVINSNPAVIYDTNPIANLGTNTDNTNNTINNILGIKIKSQAERDAEKAAKNAEEAILAEEARVAKNNDGTFAYGYTNGQGAQYTNGARYVDARSVNNSRYTASAGSSMGDGFLPTTFGGWILLILLIMVLVFIIKALNQKFNQRPVRNHSLAHQ
jgi:hypothetical protein